MPHFTKTTVCIAYSRFSLINRSFVLSFRACLCHPEQSTGIDPLVIPSLPRDLIWLRGFLRSLRSVEMTSKERSAKDKNRAKSRRNRKVSDGFCRSTHTTRIFRFVEKRILPATFLHAKHAQYSTFSPKSRFFSYTPKKMSASSSWS